MTSGAVKLTAAQIKKRIRYLLANEIRRRLYEAPDYLEHEPPEIEKAWSNVVGDIADMIWLETRPWLGRSALGKDGG